MTAAEFIRSLPDTMPIDEVIKQGEAMGIRITRGNVSTTRSVLRKNKEMKEDRADRAISPAVAKIWDFLKGFVEKTSRPPSSIEIASATGSSTGSISQALKILRRRGLLHYEDGDYKSLRLRTRGLSTGERRAKKKTRAEKRKHGPSPESARQLYDFLAGYIAQHGRGPSLGEIKKETGHSQSFVTNTMRHLAATKRVAFSSRDYIGMRLLGAPRTPPPLPPPPPMSNGRAAPESYLPRLKADLTRRLGELALSGDATLASKTSAIKEVIEMLEEREP